MRARPSGLTPRLQRLLLAVVAFVPLWWTSPGKVSADTKSYLTLDPARLLAKAPWMWDPSVGLGTVTHQTIGYLFPLGPYYWLMQRLHIPDWFAQRLWLGAVFWAAGAGVMYLAHRCWGWRGSAVLVAALAYQLSPYVLDYAARISVILLPWAALGWLVAFTARAVDDGGWRWPAAFALTVTAIGGVNATALVLAGLGPLVWLAHAVMTRAVAWRRALGAAMRIGALTVPISAWWIVALAIQGRYGIPILRYTESYEAVARTSTAPEVLRGLGYWFFYGRDKVSPWVGPASAYTQHLWLVIVSYAVPALALTALAATRWRQRGFVTALAITGVVVSVGAHPYGAPSAYGALFKRFAHTTAGDALRSTPRAVPLIAFALALALGAGAGALAARWPSYQRTSALVACGLVAVNLPSLWTGSLLTPSILRPPSVPEYWTRAARALDGGDHETRVFESPGSDFADYRWGGTVDPITPGLIDRPYAARELIPYGSAASADMLGALERRLQDRTAEPAAMAPLLRRLSVGTVASRNDLQYERYRLPRPRQSTAAWAATPGLTPSASFGDAVPNAPIARLPLVDAEELTTPASLPDPAPVTLYEVGGARPIVSAQPATAPIVYAGDGEGLVDVAAAGLLDNEAPVLSAADLAARPGALASALTDDAHIVVTDSNRRQGRRWGSVRENLGYTETAGEVPLRADPTDNRLDVFANETDDDRTVAVLQGVRRVRATAYGNPITFTPEDRAAMALDADPRTAWRVGAFAPVDGERIEIDLQAPVTTDHVTLLQPINGPRNRWITRVLVRVDSRPATVVDLDDASRVQPGQRISLGASRTFSRLSIEIAATNFTKLPGYRGISAVGFAEIGIDGVPAVVENVRLPVDIAHDAAGARAMADHALTLIMSRDRASALEVNRSDPEPFMARTFTLPAARSFTVGGTARLAPRADDAVLARAAPAGTVAVVASDRLNGDVATRGASALDGDSTTAWQTPIGAPLQQLSIDAGRAVTVDHFDLAVRADGRHSVPTALTVAVDGGTPIAVAVPPIVDQPARDALATVHLPLAQPVSGRHFVVGITDVREVRTIDYTSEVPVVLPVAVAELGAPTLTNPRATAIGVFDSGCRHDLVTIDDQPIGVRIRQPTSSAPTRDRSLTITSCGDGDRVDLTAGDHELRTAAGRDIGIDLDRIVLDTPALASRQAGAGASVAPKPAMRIVDARRTSYTLEASGATTSWWLILGQSHNTGWHATVDGRDLGPPTLVDGYANGWRVGAATAGHIQRLTLTWTPQRAEWIALAVSVIAAVACLVLLVTSPRRRSTGPQLPAWGEATWSLDATPTRRRALAVTLAVALGALAVSGWITALAVAVLACVALSLPRRYRWAIALVPGALVMLAAAYVAAKQFRYRLPTDLDWPRAFEPMHTVGWCAVACTVLAVALSREGGATLAAADGEAR